MIHKKIEKLYPHLDENLLTYNLIEEGILVPFLNFWVSSDIDIENVWGYEIEFNYYTTSKIRNYFIHPIFDVQDDCSVIYEKENWSIEEMIDIIDIIVNKKKVDLVKESNE